MTLATVKERVSVAVFPAWSEAVTTSVCWPRVVTVLPLTKASPYWISVSIASKLGQALRIPLESGHIDVVLPAALFKDRPAQIQVKWIDFLR